MATDKDGGMIDVKGRPFYVMTLNVTLANIPDDYQTIFRNVKFTFPHVAFCAQGRPCTGCNSTVFRWNIGSLICK